MIDYLYQNWDLFAVGIVTVMTVVIGFIVYFANNSSSTNKTFLGLTLFTALWGILNYLSYQSQFAIQAFTILRFTIFSVTWLLLFFLFFSLSFPDQKIRISKVWRMIFLAWTSIVSILTLTSLVFVKAGEVSSVGTIISVVNGPLLPVFGMTTTGFALSSIIILLVKTFKAKRENRRNFIFITIGVAFMFLAIMVSNFIMPVVFNNSSYIPIAALFVFPFIILTSYTIAKNNIFNVKIIGAEIFMIFLLLLTLFQFIQAPDLSTVLLRGGIFISLLGVGVLLIKNIMQEVKQREQLEILDKALEEANEKLKGLDKLKTEFLSLATHQIRSPLTAIKGYASMVVDGDFGEINPKAKEAVDRIFESSNNMAIMIEDFLSVSKIESGGMKYEMQAFPLAEVARDMAKDLSITSGKKGLHVDYTGDPDAETTVNADKEKIRQVVLNFVDNSIKYTKEGSIAVSVKKEGEKVIFRVTDTGMGMTPEIKATLFQKFARGDGARMNTSGSGLGLYLAKQIIEAHKGRVWVDSEGPNKGSTFGFELDAVK